jgi:cation diffusion facilitator CzcD-associated flavoprotein CzcO
MDAFDVDIAIIGSGFSGLGMAIRLKQDGLEDFTVLERGDDVGGTWHFNTYPGCACDVPSHLYSFSFAPNPGWSETYSRQPEIRDYLRRVADDYGLRPHVRTGCDVTGVVWSDGGWNLETSDGPLRARVVVAGTGPLAEPRTPPLQGLEAFRGETFHSARWNHDYDLTGKRVAVIGTGASAIQIVPEVAKQAAHLDVYQRTAPWVMPRGDRPYKAIERFAFRHLPLVQKAYRTGIYWGRECFVPGFTINPKLAAPAKKLALQNIERGISDPELRKAVTPHFQIGCKRILISNTWYPMLAQDNVDLVTDGIAEVRANSVVTHDGTVREVDAIIVATGFHVTDSPTYQRIVGKDGRSLASVWDEQGQQAYKGTAVAGFPNLLFVVGPNTGLGHSSMVYMIESHLNYLSSALKAMDGKGIATFEVRPEVQHRYNADLQSNMGGTIWKTGGCASWYLDKHGNNTTLWPSFTFAFRNLTRRFDVAAYTTTPRAARAGRRLESVQEGVSA